MTRTMNRLTFCVGAMIAASGGCSPRSPLSPVADLHTISGYVYFQHPSGGEPLLANAVISVQDVDGSPRMVLSNADGFYTISVRSGQVAITASKEGYEAKVSHFVLLNDTVLNFSLDPA
jgi:carboxypeptidase family protein